MSTPYHARYFAYELTRQGGAGIERLSRSLFDACIDLNPHQGEAALFATRLLITKEGLLADGAGSGNFPRIYSPNPACRLFLSGRRCDFIRPFDYDSFVLSDKIIPPDKDDAAIITRLSESD